MDFRKLDDSIIKIPFFLEVYLSKADGRIRAKTIVIDENNCSYTKLFKREDDAQLPDEPCVAVLIKQAVEFFKTLALSSETSNVNILKVDGLKSCEVSENGLREYALVVEYLAEK